MKTIISIIVAAAVVIGAAVAIIYGVHHSNNNSPASSSNQSQLNAPASGRITITSMLFRPSQITVAKGGTVTWTNDEKIVHTVVDDLPNVGGPNSGDIAPGATYSFTFNKAGSFQYHDRLHTSMRGTIVVK